MHTTVTDFVTAACSKACHHQRAVASLHQSGHDFAQAGAHGGGVLLAGLMALAVIGCLVIRDRIRRARGRA